MFSGNNITKTWITSGFVYLFLVALLGVIMRSNVFIDLPIPYTHILHAHSHTALLGWAFVMSIGRILSYFILNIQQFKSEIVALSISIMGMCITFLYQSYGAMSIAFSTLFVISAYIILFKIYQKLHTDTLSAQLLQWAIIWFFISTLGIWCIGPTSAILGKSHDLYNLSIQFFLHFQINGWLSFVALAILLENTPQTKQKFLLLGLNISLVLTFALNLYWVFNGLVFYLLNAIGLLIQWVVYIGIAYHLFESKKNQKHDIAFKSLFYWILLVVLLKPTIQLITLSPTWAVRLEFNRFLIIAFLHLILIGLVSFTFIYNAFQERYLIFNRITKTGIIFWILGFIITEIIITLQGFGVNNYSFFVALLSFSVLMLVGIGMLLYQRLNL
ncbi:hypothetical protein GO491_01435 [Flavobacteriaceae bacterium Ap0902]|nr:hypothetical protein [Flavobacteriaceae bacterium Ap0902]